MHKHWGPKRDKLCELRIIHLPVMRKMMLDPDVSSLCCQFPPPPLNYKNNRVVGFWKTFSGLLGEHWNICSQYLCNLDKWVVEHFFLANLAVISTVICELRSSGQRCQLPSEHDGGEWNRSPSIQTHQIHNPTTPKRSSWTSCDLHIPFNTLWNNV